MLPAKLILGINKRGVHFFRPVPKEYIHSAELRDIMQFGSSTQAVFFKMRVAGGSLPWFVLFLAVFFGGNQEFYFMYCHYFVMFQLWGTTQVGCSTQAVLFKMRMAGGTLPWFGLFGLILFVWFAGLQMRHAIWQLYRAHLHTSHFFKMLIASAVSPLVACVLHQIILKSINQSYSLS